MSMAILSVQRMDYLKAFKTFGVSKTTLINNSLQKVTFETEPKRIFFNKFATDLVEYLLEMEAERFDLTQRDLMKLLRYLKKKCGHSLLDRHGCVYSSKDTRLFFRRSTGTSIVLTRKMFITFYSIGNTNGPISLHS